MSRVLTQLARPTTSEIDTPVAQPLPPTVAARVEQQNRRRSGDDNSVNLNGISINVSNVSGLGNKVNINSPTITEINTLVAQSLPLTVAAKVERQNAKAKPQPSTVRPPIPQQSSSQSLVPRHKAKSSKKYRYDRNRKVRRKIINIARDLILVIVLILFITFILTTLIYLLSIK
jgi:hypothetical protein